MTSQDVLAILKFSLPAVAFASVILGKLKDVRRDGPDGERRLTFHGQVLTGLTIISAFISLFAAGFEAILKRQDEARNRAKAQTEQIERIRKSQDAQRAEAARAAGEQAFRDAEAARARKLESRLIDQKLAFLAEAAEAQRRAATISRQLGEASAARLADAERSLAEFARINYPLRKIVVGVEIELNLAGPEVARQWDRLIAKYGVACDTRRHEADPNRRVTLDQGDLGREPRFVYAANGNAIVVAFFTPETAPPAALRPAAGGGALRPIAPPTGNGASFIIRLGQPTVTADLVARIATAHFETTLEPDHEGEFGGRKLSMADAARLIPILTVQRNGAKRFPRGPDRMTASATLNDDQRFGLGRTVAVTDDPVAFVLRR